MNINAYSTNNGIDNNIKNLGENVIRLFPIFHSKISALCLIVLSCCILTSCANLPGVGFDAKFARTPAQPGEVKISGDTIIYNGYINALNNSKLFDAFETAERLPVKLTITSGGGSVEYGLELGEWIVEKQLDVHIPELCGSSCANYVFTAGKQVTLAKDAVVMWHGSPVMDDLLAGTPQAKARWEGVKKSLMHMKPDLVNPRGFWNKIRIRNRRFFRTVGVHPIITTLNFVADESSSAKIMEAGSWKSYGTYMSIADMKYFGVDNVRVEGDNPWVPDPTSILGDGLIKVTLVENVEERLAELKKELNEVL